MLGGAAALFWGLLGLVDDLASALHDAQVETYHARTQAMQDQCQEERVPHPGRRRPGQPRRPRR